MDTTKIIKGVVNSGRYTVTAPIVKEDYGLYLQIEGVELPSTYEVDFSNSEHNGTSVTMIGNSDGVLIPRQFIDTGKDIFAFLYHVGANYGRTVYKFRIPNKCRPDRTDDTPTPEEQSVIDQAISALNTAVEQTAQDVINADASAQSAQESAEQAETAKSDAQTYANNAQASATSASQSAQASANSATASAQSASQSAQIKTDIEGYVSTAQGYAQTATDKAAQASQSATNASNSATTASTKAGEASASATTASNKASEASGYATTASNKASEASGYASTASQKASDASDSASAALGYKTAAQTAQGLAETAQGKAEDAQEAAETAAASIQSSAAQIAENTEDIADLQTDVAQNEADVLKAFPTDTASGAIASFSDGADDIPLRSLVVNIDPVQDTSSGDPSPTNICPISGWTGMQLNANGTVIPISWQTEAGTVYGGRLDVVSGVMRVEIASIQIRDTNWTTQSTNAFKTNLDKKIGMLIPMSDAYKSANPVASLDNLPNNSITIHRYAYGENYRKIVYIKDTRYTEAADFASAMGDHQIVYALNTPIEIQLTPHEVNSLYGQNNIFADTGDCSVEYRADTKLYIEKLTAPDSADMIADANIVSGQYFMVGNSLYLATANIASGAQVIVGTNATRKSLSEALNEINA